MSLKSSFSEYTEAEFLEFMETVFQENVAEADERLDMLLEHFEKEFPYLDFPPVPKRGDLELKEVLKADYFFN